MNPLDYWQTPDVVEVQSYDHRTQLELLEQRFRFLAADGVTVLRGNSQEITYRQVLIRICHYLKMPYSQQMTTVEIESEIFLNLLGRAWKKLPASERKTLTARVQKSLADSNFSEPLPVQLQHNPIQFILKGSSVIAISSVLKSIVLQQIARQFALHYATYQVAKTTLVKGGTAVAAQIQNRVTMQMASRGMALAAARQGAVKTVFAVLGPMLWVAFFADIGWRAIATNYGRIIPTVFAIAQIRLLRMDYCYS
ncbi:MAG: hypothetical protein F6K03_11765 [Kamptonema sp. SIO4C4]|nr:hypothetical protein [Kamptonema sp. SIO4C4]